MSNVETGPMQTAKDSVLHHRSKNRIRNLGEVFTPDKYVHEMLDMLDKSVWSDTNTVFFEPTCGHGNFVVTVLERRLNALFQKAKRSKITDPKHYALANALNNLWAIDVDEKNIEHCQKRVWALVLQFLFPKKITWTKKNKDFLAHILCCIKWQIQVNEALSCLQEEATSAKIAADKTSISRKWFAQNGHHPIDFDLTWCEYFRALKENNTIPISFKRSHKFLSSLEKRQKINHFKDFNFAKTEAT